MSRIQWKAGAAVVLLLLGAVLAAAWQRESEQPTAALPSAAPRSPNSAPSAMTNIPAQNTAAVSAIPATPPAPQERAMVHPEDEKPSPKVIAAIREMKKPMPDEGKVTTNPDGSQKLSLGNRYMSVPVATRGKDGKVHVDYHGERYSAPEEKQP